MVFEEQDIQDNKVLAAISYLFLLCLIPLLGKKDSAFAMHHGRQGLALACYGVAASLFNMIPIIGWLFGWIFLLIWLIGMVIGFVKAMNGETWEVPVIGSYFNNVKL